MVELAGMHAIVTGGGRGIGAAIADALAQAGARVTIMGRTRQHDENWIECDVADAQSVERAFAKAGSAAILVNNAGQAESAPFTRTSLEMWRRMLDVNLTGTFLCTRAVLPEMLAAGFGRIVNVASVAGLAGFPYVSAYCASKHGVVGLTRALAAELAAGPITVNAVCPGYTETDLVRKAVANIMAKTGQNEDEARAGLARGNANGRLLQPAEVADAVIRLIRHETLTGQAVELPEGRAS